MRMRTWWIAALALLAAVPRGAAQAPATAEDAARAFLAALDGHQWAAAAGFLSDASARRQRDLTLSFALAQLETLQKHGGGGNFVLSGSGALDSARLRRFAAHRVRSLRGVSTVAEAAALEPREFLARMMESAVTGPPGAIAQPASHRYLGIVVENDSVAHALFREEGPGAYKRFDQGAEVLELRREGGRWYVLPNELMFMRVPLLFGSE